MIRFFQNINVLKMTGLAAYTVTTGSIYAGCVKHMNSKAEEMKKNNPESTIGWKPSNIPGTLGFSEPYVKKAEEDETSDNENHHRFS